MSLGDWEDILDAFANRGCAVCGRHFPHYDKGHLNPELPMTLDNIVPMCVDCNNWAGRQMSITSSTREHSLLGLQGILGSKSFK